MTRAARRRIVRSLRKQAGHAVLGEGFEEMYCEIGVPPRWAGAPFYEEKLAAVRQFYAIHRVEILARAESGWRPWAWWKWDPDAPPAWRDIAGPVPTPEQTVWALQREETA